MVSAGRGIARHARTHGLAQAQFGNELAHGRHPVDARAAGAVARDAGVAEFALELGRERERHVDAIRRQESSGAVRPFEYHHRILRQVVKPKLG